VNVIVQAQQAYAPKQFPLRSSRSVEAELIGQITSRLKKASTDPKRQFPALVAALHDNRQLWSTMAADVSDSSNTLPAPLRAQIFYLAEFSELHSRKVLSGSATTDVLVEINTAILRGLNSIGTK
jgi:flagellar protein FlaF